jgi:hypothetical protein
MHQLDRPDAHALQRRNDASHRVFDLIERFVVRKLQRGQRDGGLRAILGDGRSRLLAVGARRDLI